MSGRPPSTPSAAAAHRRQELLEVLRAAREEASTLAEMIRLLGQSPGMGGARIVELHLEWRVAQERTDSLEAELQALDARDRDIRT